MGNAVTLVWGSLRLAPNVNLASWLFLHLVVVAICAHAKSTLIIFAILHHAHKHQYIDENTHCSIAWYRMPGDEANCSSTQQVCTIHKQYWSVIDDKMPLNYNFFAAMRTLNLGLPCWSPRWHAVCFSCAAAENASLIRYSILVFNTLYWYHAYLLSFPLMCCIPSESKFACRNSDMAAVQPSEVRAT